MLECQSSVIELGFLVAKNISNKHEGFAKESAEDLTVAINEFVFQVIWFDYKALPILLFIGNWILSDKYLTVYLQFELLLFSRCRLRA